MMGDEFASVRSNTWQAFRIVLRADSPLHIGWHKLGFIERTRLYIHGRALWGALVERIARNHQESADVAARYDYGRTFCERVLRFTYLFLEGSSLGHSVSTPPLPGADITMEALADSSGVIGFESKATFSETSTAIAQDTFAAQYGSLHETEYLSHEMVNPETSARKRLNFMGYIFVRSDSEWGPEPEPHLRNALTELCVGGDRKYGRGILSLVALDHVPDGSLFDCFRVQSGSVHRSANLRVEIHDKFDGTYAHFPAHLLADPDANSLKPAGDIEAVSGRDWVLESGSGRGLVHLMHYWTPGTQVNVQSEINKRADAKRPCFEIDTYGYWRTIIGSAGT